MADKKKALYMTKTEKIETVSDAPSTISLLSFDRWFTLTKRPAHHKGGLVAFIKGNISGKRPKEVWDKLFQNY